MNARNDGGSAFPTGDHPDSRNYTDPGMTLRDYFAAKALAALIGQTAKDPEKRGKKAVPLLASFAYEYADAMLAERSK